MQDLVSQIYVQSKSLAGRCYCNKNEIIINLWRLQHERSTFNTNDPKYPALLVLGGEGMGLVWWREWG